MIATAEYSSASACIASARAIRARLLNPPRPVREALPPEPRVIPFYASQIPLWERRPTQFDAHITAWRAMRALAFSRAARPVRAYIEARAAEFGLTHQDVTGKSQVSRICAVRHLINFEIKTLVKPDISFPELGQAMGGRDHTTVLGSVVKMTALGTEGRAALESRLRGSQKIPRDVTGPNMKGVILARSGGQEGEGE